MKDSILNINNKGEYHGYVELYWANTVELRCKYYHGVEIGYLEWHDGKITTYYIK